MEPQLYYFGSLPDGFSSYPSDHTKTFFEQFLKRSKNEAQIVVHREGNLLHYGYVRKFNNNYFGICLCIDCIYNDVDFLFTVFDDIYADMIKNGDVLKIASNGNVEWKIMSYVEEAVALNEYSKTITELVNINKSNSVELPPADFSISINDCLEISLEASKEEITDATKRYPNLYIAKTKAEVERVNSFHNTIKNKNILITKLREENQELKKRNEELDKKKKQFQLVVFLALAILGCGIGLFLLNDNLNVTKNELAEAKNTISIKDDSITSKNNQISSLRQDVHNLNVNLNEEKNKREQVESDFESFKSSLNEMQPFIVKNTSFNWSTGRLSFDYYGFRDADVRIQARAMGSTSYSNTSTVTIQKGFHSSSIYLSSSLNSSNWYSFELLVNNKIIGGDRH